MASLLDAAKDWYRSESWGFDVADGKSLLRLRYEGKSGSWPCFVQVEEEDALFVFYSLCLEDVPLNRVAAVVEYLTRANAALSVGSFELEYESQAVRFRTSVDVEGGELAPHLIRNVSLSNVVTVDRFLPGLQAVLRGGSPEKCLPPHGPDAGG
jgi:hypothetical protein